MQGLISDNQVSALALNCELWMHDTSYIRCVNCKSVMVVDELVL